MTSPQHGDFGHVALIVVAALLISLKGILAKFIYAEGVSVEATLLLRAWMAQPLVWLWVLSRTSLGRVLAVNPWLIAGAMLVGVACYYLGAWLDFVALQLIDASLERVLLFTYPMLVVIARAVVYRRMPAPRVVVAVALTWVGVIFAVGGSNGALWRANQVGALLVLISACGFAYYMMANERYTRRASSATFIGYSSVAAAAALTIHFSAVASLPDLVIPTRAWVYIFLMTLFTNVLPLFLFSASIRKIGAERAAIVSSVGPPATMIFAVYLLGESMAVSQYFGSALIVVGIVILEVRQKAVAQAS